MFSLIDLNNLSEKQLEEIIDLGVDIIDNRGKYSERCHGKKLATLFYEPSTRTRLSFTAAMMELGGNVLGFSDANNSSASKGETLADTAQVVSCFADIIAIRHYEEGAAMVAALNARVPVINAGDGTHSHPTQTLTDLLTIKREIGRFDNITVGFCGDLKYGRTVHSLIKALARFKGVRIVLISPRELRLPGYIKHEVMNRNGMTYKEVASLEEAMEELDVLYMTRVQKERFTDLQAYEEVKDAFILSTDKLKNAKPEMRILHPLPRVNEITVDVDADPRAAYFRQVENGKFVRMALIVKLLEWQETERQELVAESVIEGGYKCPTATCVANRENVPARFRLSEETPGKVRCFYCEHAVK